MNTGPLTEEETRQAERLAAMDDSDGCPTMTGVLGSRLRRMREQEGPKMHVTWALKNRHNKMYVQGLSPVYADLTFKRGKALRFLTLEAARDERKGWVDRKARKSLRIMRITTKV